MTPLFVELCAGTAALSLRLQGGNRCRPVVSRMGAKTGYANVILSCFGLTPGGKAGAYLWCEPDPGARLLLQALPQPEVLREAASVLRGWASEDPRTLWEALRKEGPPKGCDGREVARNVMLGTWAFKSGDPSTGFHDPAGTYAGVDPSRERSHRIARRTAPAMGDRLDAYPSLPPTTITEDARTVDPREVARIIQLATSNELINIAWSDAAQAWRNTGKGGTTFGGDVGFGADRAPAKIDTLQAVGWPPVAVTSDAREIDPPRLPEGTICYIDGPYERTTGYGNLLPRHEQVRMARLWKDAGAFVGVSEQVPIPELMAEGWHAVRITNGRKGQARTFSKQKDEWLTLSRPPINAPLLGEQQVLL